MWKTVKLGDICLTTDYVANGSFKSLRENVKYLDEDGFAILVRLTDFTKGWNGNYKYVSEDAYNFLSKSALYAGDLVISNVGEPGKTFLVPNLEQPMTLAPNSILVRPNDESLSTRFLKYFIDSRYGQELIRSIESGTTQRKFNKTSFRALECPLPPLAEQQRIVAKLDAAFAEIDSAIKLVETKQAHTEKLKASLLDVSLTSDDALWKTVKISDVCKIVNGSTPSRKEKSFWEDGDISWFTIDDMREQGRDIFTTAQHVTQKAVEEKKVKLVPANSVLLCCTASIGEASIARKEMATNQQFNSLTPLTNDLSCEYLYYVATTLKDTLLRVSGSTTISFVSMGKLKEIKIPLPPLAEQQRIVATLDAAFTEIEAVFSTTKLAIDSYTALKSSLLTREFNPSEAA